VRVPVADAGVLPAIIRGLDETEVELAEFALRKPSLDEVFLALTGGDRPRREPPASTGPEGLERNPQ
jgi:oleandomycin transport system ATP-binding protein